MIIGLKTPYKTALNIFNIPLAGPFIFLVIACFTLPFALIVNHFFHFATNYQIEQANLIIMPLWNLLLSFVAKIKISIFFIPCWLAFGIIGALKYFQVIS